jgi:hypothetical protein
MKNISINPFALVIALLGSFALGALLVLALDNRYNQGLHAGHMSSQREAAQAISILMTEGFVVRQDDGHNTRYVLHAVAKPAP